MLIVIKREPKKNIKANVLFTYIGTYISTELISFESLLIIRPKGTLSKNSFKDEKSKLLIIDSCIYILVFGAAVAIIKILVVARIA